MIYNRTPRYQPLPVSLLSITANSSNLTVNFGAALVLTANVASSSGPAPTGNVVVTNTSTGTTLGTLAVGSSSNITTTTIFPGVYTLTFTYSGDSNYPSLSTTLTQTVRTSIYSTNASTSTLVGGQKLNLASNATINIPGRIVVNSPVYPGTTVKNYSKLIGSSIQIVASIQKDATATVSPTPVQGADQAVSDPLATLAVPSVTGTATYIDIIDGTMTLNPGIYSQLRARNSAQLILNPGIYVIKGGISSGALAVTNAATIIGTDVLIYVASSSYPATTGLNSVITLNSTGTINLSAPTTGPYAGILIFQQRNNTAAMTINGTLAQTIIGTIYGVNATLTLSGSIILRSALVVNQFNITGTAQVLGSSNGTY